MGDEHLAEHGGFDNFRYDIHTLPDSAFSDGDFVALGRHTLRAFGVGDVRVFGGGDVALKELQELESKHEPNWIIYAYDVKRRMNGRNQDSSPIINWARGRGAVPAQYPNLYKLELGVNSNWDESPPTNSQTSQPDNSVAYLKGFAWGLRLN